MLRGGLSLAPCKKRAASIGLLASCKRRTVALSSNAARQLLSLGDKCVAVVCVTSPTETSPIRREGSDRTRYGCMSGLTSLGSNRTKIVNAGRGGGRHIVGCKENAS